MILLAVSQVLAAGYGVPVDGYPNAEERWLLLWTNAARVAPLDFTDEYDAGGCSTDDFADDEKQAKAPLYIDLQLTEAARFHSSDMAENGCFQHESCDGTDTWARIDGFYSDAAGAMGENIAMGTSDAKYAVLSMWMCSHSGHRANIMSADFNEMGPGVDGVYMTQDFAGGELKEGSPPVRMATEKDGDWYADWGDADAPTRLSVVINGNETPLELQHGTAEQGIYAAFSPEAGSDPCHIAFVKWETAGGLSGTFPELGSFASGACDGADPETGWIDDQTDPGNGHTDTDDGSSSGMLSDIELVGCSTRPGSPSGALAMALGGAAVLVRRRARPSLGR